MNRWAWLFVGLWLIQFHFTVVVLEAWRLEQRRADRNAAALAEMDELAADLDVWEHQ